MPRLLVLLGFLLLPTGALAGPAIEVPRLLVPQHHGEDSEEAGRAPTEDPEYAAAMALLKKLQSRNKLIRAHRAMGIISTTTMFAAQGFGIANHIALTQGVSRDDLAPTLNVHRALALTAVSTYFVGGLLAWTMPGPAGTAASKRLSPATPRGRRAHIALSVAHGIAMITTVTLGMVSSFSTRDTPAWNATITAHHVSAATTTTLVILAVGLQRSF